MALSRAQSHSKSHTDLVGAILCVIFAGIPLAIAPHVVLGYVTTPKLAAALLAIAWLLFLAGRWWPGVRALAKNIYGRFYLVLLLAQIGSLSLSTWLSV